MKDVHASAPGKLIVAGEYSVLHGGDAIAVAAGCRATADLSAAATASQLCIANTESCYPFTLAANQVHWQQDPGAEGALFAAAVSVLTRDQNLLNEYSPFSLRLGSRAFYTQVNDRPVKLGLGSSAAVAVALTACLQRGLGRNPDAATALAVHRTLQQGRGSGIDVYTAFLGGTVIMQNRVARAGLWPADVGIVPVWTGVAASTPDMLQRLSAFATGQPEQHDALMAALAASAAAVTRACDTADAVELLSALAAFSNELRAFDAATALGIWSPEHCALAELATVTGVVYKPSGAGGGDFGLAFSADGGALQRFRDQAGEAGFSSGDFELGVGGVAAD